MPQKAQERPKPKIAQTVTQTEDSLLKKKIEQVMDTKEYWTTGSIKVSTPEEVEELKKVAFKPLPKEGIWDYPEDEIMSMARERSDMIRSIPTPAEAEEIPKSVVDRWLDSDDLHRTTPQDWDEWTEGWIRGLTQDEQDTVRRYTGSLYDQLNPPMYTYGEEISGPQTFLATNVKQYETLDKALAKAENKSEIMTIRGMDGSPFRDLEDITPDDVGKSYTVPNYFSTSPGGGEFGGKDHILHILVPKGKGFGAYVAPISEWPREREYLLKRNGRYLIEQVEEVDGKKHV